MMETLMNSQQCRFFNIILIQQFNFHLKLTSLYLGTKETCMFVEKIWKMFSGNKKQEIKRTIFLLLTVRSGLV